MGLREKFEELKNQKPVLNQSAPSDGISYSHGEESIELDAIERLKSNILMLDDLHNRLRFMNDELENVLGSKKI